MSQAGNGRRVSRARRGGRAGQARTRVVAAPAVAALGAVCVLWAANPLAAPGGVGRVIMVAALTATAFGALRLAAARPLPGDTVVVSGAGWLWHQARAVAHAWPWPEVALVSALVLEALHPSRPWHTALLGTALLCYVFGTHLAETGARPAALRPQLPVLLAGVGLLVLAAAAGTMPAGSAGPAWLRVVAAIGVVVAGVLLLPA
jgi:hypothetical protein